MYWIRLYRNSDNTLLYQSEKQWAVSDPDNKYIGIENIKMVNVNNSNDTFTIESPFVYHIYRRLLCDVDFVEDSEGVKNTYDLPSDDFVTDNRNYKKCIGLTGGMFFCTSRAVDEPTRYGLNDYNQYFTNEVIPSGTGIGRPLAISRNSWANASLWYVYDSYYSLFEQRLRKQYTLKDSYSIAAAIKALLCLLYTSHSSMDAPVKIIKLNKIRDNSAEWFTVDDFYLPYQSEYNDAGGSWYLCYFQSELPEGSQACLLYTSSGIILIQLILELMICAQFAL